MAMPDIPLAAGDVRVLIGLREGPEQERKARYEWGVLQKLPPIERLMAKVADGPALPLSWKDEFRDSVRASRGTYIIAPNGRLRELILRLGDLSEVTKAIPVGHLSPFVQCLCLSFLHKAASSASLKKLDPSVTSAFRKAQLEGPKRPEQAFDFRMASETINMPFDEVQARALVSQVNQYYQNLSKLAKDRDVKRSQRYRINRSIAHHNRLQELFRGIVKNHQSVLLIYLELQCPPNTTDQLEAFSMDDPEGYRTLHQARAEFLKGRQHNPLFHGLIGYAWKYRYSNGIGLVCMVVLIFDHTQQSQGGALADALAARWLSVSPEGSTFWSPLHASPFPLSDTSYYGFLPTQEPDVQEYLGSLSRIMGLYDAYIKPVAPKRMHVYDSSQPPAPRKSARKKRRSVKKENGGIRPAPLVEASKRRKEIDQQHD